MNSSIESISVEQSNQEIPVVLLAGGLGLRIASGEDRLPKALIEAAGVPLIERVIHHYEKSGFRKFIICVGHEAGQIVSHGFDTLDANSKLTFVDSGPETNTSGRLLSVRDHLRHKIFMCTYADGLANVDLHGMLKCHLNSENLATVSVGKERSQYGVVELEKQGNQVYNFSEKPITANWINLGFFIFSTEVLDLLDPKKQLEPDLLPKLIKYGKLAGYKYEGNYYTIDTRKDLANLESDIQHGVIDWI